MVFHFLLGVLFLSLCNASLATAAAAGADGTLTYSIMEQVPVGTFVGNVALDAGLYKNLTSAQLQQITFTILSNVQYHTDLFTIDPKMGVVSTAKLIVRDAICHQQWTCSVQLDVILQPKDYFRVIKVQVNIQDLNDYAPTFSPSIVNFTIPELTPPGQVIFLPVATDLDSPPNGVVSYLLQPNADPFRLQTRNVSGTLEAQLNVTEVLDREVQSYYSLVLVALDGGNPPLSGSLTINIVIQDVNDNGPVFDNSTYEVHVSEGTPVGSVIVRVHATDQDAGVNGRVGYSFSARSQSIYGTVFLMDPDSGNVILLQQLSAAQQSSYSLAVQAVDQGPSAMSGFAALLIVVDPVTDRPPTIVVDVLSDNGRAEILASSPVGTFVAHVYTDDLNSLFNCSVDDTDDFQLVSLLVGGYKLVTARMFSNSAQQITLVLSCANLGGGSAAGSASGSAADQFPSSTVNLTVFIVLPSTVVSSPPSSPPPPPYIFTASLYNSSITGNSSSVNSFVTQVIGVRGNPGVNSLPFPTSKSGANPPRFLQSSYSFTIPETAAVGTSVGTVTAVSAGDSVSYQFLGPSSTMADLAVDAISGIVRTTRILDRDAVPVYQFTVVVRNVRLPVLNDTASVIVNVSENRPQITFPSQQNDNDTVYMSSSAPSQTIVAFITATMPPLPSFSSSSPSSSPSSSFSPSSQSLNLCYSLSNGSEYFNLNVLTGELTLIANLSSIYSSSSTSSSSSASSSSVTNVNYTISVSIAVSVCLFPSALSVSTLRVIVITGGGQPIPIPLAGEGGSSDTRILILACILAVCLVVVTVIVVAIILVCRRSRGRKEKRMGTAPIFWTSVQLQPRGEGRGSSSNGDRETMTDITLNLSPSMSGHETDADSGCPSNSSSSSSTEASSDDGDATKRLSNSPDKRGGVTSETSKDVFQSKQRLQTAAPLPLSSVVPDWLRGSAASLVPEVNKGPTHPDALPPSTAVLKPSLSRSGSMSSRKSIRFGPDEPKKRVQFADHDQYFECNSADVTACSDVTDSNARRPGGNDDDDDDDDDSSGSFYPNTDVARTMRNTIANCYSATEAARHYPSPAQQSVTLILGTFMPEDGSLV